MTEKQKWITLAKGIRCREHPSRKHGIKADRYFVLRYSAGGKMHQEALGWASEGVTLEKARVELAKLREAVRSGEGPQTLAEKRSMADQKRQKAQEREHKERFSAITTEEFWNEHYWPAQEQKADGSRSAEKALWNKWLSPALGNKALTSITAAELDGIKRKMLAEDKAPSTVKYAMAIISQMWSLATRDGLTSGLCPVRQIKLPKKDNKRQRYLTVQEAQRLLSELKDRSPLSYDMAIIALESGLRFSEIANLTWQDCDFSRGTLLVRDPKARANRFAFITDSIRMVLEHRKQESDEGLIFYDSEGKKMTRISKTFRRIADELFNHGCEDPRLRVCFHTLRHTFASKLVESGAPLYHVKELLGHADIKMTQRYSHLSPDGMKQTVLKSNGD